MSEHVLVLYPILDTNDWIGAFSVQVAELNAPLSFILSHSGRGAESCGNKLPKPAFASPKGAAEILYCSPANCKSEGNNVNSQLHDIIQGFFSSSLFYISSFLLTGASQTAGVSGATSFPPSSSNCKHTKVPSCLEKK